MGGETYSRRRFVRHGITLAGAGLGLDILQSAQAADDTTGKSVSLDTGLKELLHGNERYVTGRHTHHDYGPERPALALGQKPFAVVVSCSDSRVAPELAFDQSRGRLFVVRVAGNFIDENQLASVEYSVSVLGSSLILVLGHTECGALKAAVDVVTKGTVLPGHLPKLINHLKEPVERVRSQGGSIVDNAIRENVRLNVQKLRTSEPILAGLVASGRLQVVGGIYDLATGRVTLVTA
jgi:carbonic anhydrase